MTDSSPMIAWLEDFDELLIDLLTELCETHLAQLRQNAATYGEPPR